MVSVALMYGTKVGAEVVGARELVIVEATLRDAGFGHVDDLSVVSVMMALEAQVEDGSGHGK